MKEPSVLDYLKSRLNPWQKEKIQLPQPVEEAQPENPARGAPQQAEAVSVEAAKQEAPAPETAVRELALDTEQFAKQIVGTFHLAASHENDLRELIGEANTKGKFPWRTLLAMGVALLAQRMFEPPASSIPLGVALYFFALLLLAWAYFDKEFALPEFKDGPEAQTDPQTFHQNSLIFALVLAAVAFFLFSGNLFTPVNVTLWLVDVGLYLRSLWLSSRKTGEAGSPQQPGILTRMVGFFRRDVWQISFTRWTILLVAVALVIIFFRFYRLDGVPGEPFSDHAEKLLDVFDVTQGQTHIFFPRNTGREFIQFYWTDFLAGLLGTGLSFLTLKIGTALIGLFTLPYVYLLGKEIGGKRVALFALVLAGTSYWLNTISRIGLRFPLYPAFAAPTLYYLLRGLRKQTRNDFILSGLFLGLGLNGYSPFRFVPIVALVAVGIYLLHKNSKTNRQQTILMFSILVLASFLIFLPLLRYALENPDMFSYRAMTRLTGSEQALSAPAWQIFISNTYRAMTMFNYDDGEIWVHSIPHRPALDIISAVLFVFGYIFLFVRYLRKRDWSDLFIFLSVPLLLMPSILSLAFPNENPSLNRTGGAAAFVFVIAALALDGIYTSLKNAKIWRGTATVLVAGLLLASSMQNYNLVFDKFATQFMAGAWNTSDMGNVIHSFVVEGNSPDNAFVVPYPYWVDTRLVGIQAGYPTKDYALSRDHLSDTQPVTGNKLFIVKEDDQQTLVALRQLYPSGLLGHFTNPLEGKNFWTYLVPDPTLNP